MGLDIAKGALKPASKPKSKPQPAQRPPPALSPPTPSSLVTGTPRSPAATAPAALGSPLSPKPRIKQTARRSSGGRRPKGWAPPTSAPQDDKDDDSVEAGHAPKGSLSAAQGSSSSHDAHVESSRRAAAESVGESPPIVVDATASSSSGSGGSDGELEAQLNGFDSPWSRQYASAKAPPVIRGGRRFDQQSASSSRSSAAAARRDSFASGQDFIPLEHQQRSLAPAGGHDQDVDVGMDEATPEPQVSQGPGSSSPASKLQSPGPSVVGRYGREEEPQGYGRRQAQRGAVEQGEREVGGEVGVTGSASPDGPPSYKRRIDEVIGDEDDEPAGRRKRIEAVEQDEVSLPSSRSRSPSARGP